MKYSLVTKERDLKCWQYFLKVFTNKCKQHNLYCINIQIQCHCVPCTPVQGRSYAYYHFPAFCCPVWIFPARLWGLLSLGSLLTGIMCQLAELVLGFEVQCTEGHPFGVADFPLDPYFLLPAAVTWIGICGPRWSLPLPYGNTSIHWSKLMKCRGK